VLHDQMVKFLGNMFRTGYVRHLKHLNLNEALTSTCHLFILAEAIRDE